MTYNNELDYTRIKTLREENGYSQKDIAEFLKINQSTYSKFELMKSNITIEKLNDLANFYDVSLDYILKLSDKKEISLKNKHLDNQVIGKNLKTIREEKKLYQDTLAKNIGTSHSLISEYEHGKKMLSLTYGYAICKKYNISMDYLYGKVNSPKHLK